MSVCACRKFTGAAGVSCCMWDTLKSSKKPSTAGPYWFQTFFGETWSTCIMMSWAIVRCNLETKSTIVKYLGFNLAHGCIIHQHCIDHYELFQMLSCDGAYIFLFPWQVSPIKKFSWYVQLNNSTSVICIAWIPSVLVYTCYFTNDWIFAYLTGQDFF